MGAKEKSISEIKDDIKSFLSKHIKDCDFGDDQNFFTSGILTSMFAMQLLVYVENNFDIKVENKDLDLKNFSTLNAIGDFIDRKLCSTSCN